MSKIPKKPAQVPVIDTNKPSFKSPRELINLRSPREPKIRSPGELQNKTQKTAFQILQKEETNVKKGRLECLLVQQFIGKYGSKNPHSEINDFIKKTVRQFVNSYDSVIQAESALGSLESQLAEIVQNMKQAKKAKKESEATEAQIIKQQSAPQLERQRSGTGPLSASNNQQNIDKAQWPVINAILALSDEEKRIQEERALAAKKEKLQQDLNKQIAENKRRAAQEQAEKAAALEKNIKNLELFNKDVAEQKHKQEDKFKTERDMRLVQIEYNKQQREAEKLQRIAQEQAEIARAKRLVEEEEEIKRQQKAQQKRAHDLLIIENEKNKALKAEMLRERQEYEKKLNREYEAKLEREEIARANAFQTRMDALQHFASNYESRVGAKLKQEAADTEKATFNALKEKERQDMERERLKVETRKQQSLQSAEYNVQMMEAKRAAKEKERLEAVERRLKLEADVAEAKLKERETNDAKKLRMIEMKQNLDQQVSMKNATSKRETNGGLSDIELNMNKSIIKKLNEDPVLMNKVLEKVHPVVNYRAAASTSANNIFG